MISLAFVGIGDVGSLTDLATLVVALVVLRETRNQQDTGHAVVVAAAEWTERVVDRLDTDLPRLDADLVRADLDVAKRESAAYLDEPIRADGGFPAEAEPDGDVSAPHHFYIGVALSTFAFVSIWDLYPVTGAGLVLVGLAVAVDDALSHAFGIPTPLDWLWNRIIYPALPST